MRAMFPTVDRRQALAQLGSGFGLLAAQWMAARDGWADDAVPKPRAEFNGGLHRPAKVRRVIQLFMNGGASPMDTFDYKPELERVHGQMLGPKEKPEGFTGAVGAMMKCPFPFAQHGETGRWVSSVFPHQAKLVDDLTFLMAMASKTNVHGQAAFMMNTGFLLPGFPCLGAWLGYALGSIVDNLPTFVVLPDARGLPYNQKATFSAGFLPAVHQGTVIDAAAPRPVPFLRPDEKHAFAGGAADEAALAALRRMDERRAARDPSDTRFDARISSYELAAKMQASAPEAFDLSRETAATHAAYGLGEAATQDFGRRCLLARRLIERGTRFVQVWSGPQGAAGNWDNHGNIVKELPPIATSVDQPIAALLRDLKARGLTDDTLVIWTTEFGRTPFEQGSGGRDHNGGTFVTWLYGAGVKPGVSHGRSDDWAWKTAEGKTMCYDLHATILHLMGIDHERLTFYHNGIARRLTDVHGHVIQEILA